jgi:hypothetical protein
MDRIIFVTLRSKEMIRFYYTAFLLLTGLFLTPAQSYACGAESAKTKITCNKKSDSEVEKESCCNTEKKQCDNHGKNCDGECGNTDCHCPTSCTNCIIPIFAQFPLKKLILSKPKFSYQEAFYSSGFLSIWLPPKIG